MPSAAVSAWIALPVALVLGGCASAPRLPALTAFGAPALPMRGDVDARDDGPPLLPAEAAPRAEPAPLGLATHCGGSRGEQARAQCLRGVHEPAHGAP